MTPFEKFTNGLPFWSNDKSLQLFYCPKNKVIGDYLSHQENQRHTPNIYGFIWRVHEIIENRFVYVYQGNVCKDILIDVEVLEFV